MWVLVRGMKGGSSVGFFLEILSSVLWDFEKRRDVYRT